MKLTYKSIILLIIILIFAIVSIFFIVKMKNKNIPPKQITPNEVYQLSQNSNSPLNELWNNYSDQRYDFSLDYPSNLNVHPIYENRVNLADSLGGGFFIVNGGASFSQNDGYWIIIVDVLDKDNKVNVSSLDEWLEKENKKVEHQVNVIEKRIKIDGYDAIVTYAKSVYDGQEESFKREKKTVFIKDGILFEINTRGIDHERVWNSFKFKK